MRLRHLVVPVDFSDPSRAAFTRAMQLAEQFEAELVLLHSVPVTPYPVAAEFGIPISALDRAEEYADAKMKGWAREAQERGVAVSARTVETPPVDAIHQAVCESQAELVVMGTHGHSGIQHLFLGSVAERTLRTATCPVLAVKEPAERVSAPFRRVLAAVDFSPDSDHALAIAIEYCRGLHAELSLAHVFAPVFPIYGDFFPVPDLVTDLRERAGQDLEERAQRARDAGLGGAAHLLDGEPSSAIAHHVDAHGVELVVMGTRGHTGIQHVALGSITERTLRRSPCSVLVTHAGDQTRD